MKLSKAFDRLRYTISNGNKPNGTDVEAFNCISNHLQKTESNTIQDNLLFAKLYAFVLAEFCNHYTDIDFANKQLNRLLSEPIDIRIQMLLLKIREQELRKLFLSANIKDEFLKEKTFEELEEVAARYSGKIQPFDLKNLQEWDEDFVISMLNHNINLSFQNFKNEL